MVVRLDLCFGKQWPRRRPVFPYGLLGWSRALHQRSITNMLPWRPIRLPWHSVLRPYLNKETAVLQNTPFFEHPYFSGLNLGSSGHDTQCCVQSNILQCKLLHSPRLSVDNQKRGTLWCYCILCPEKFNTSNIFVSYLMYNEHWLSYVLVSSEHRMQQQHKVPAFWLSTDSLGECRCFILMNVA